MVRYFIYVHKNLVRVNDITSAMKENLGGRVHVLDHGNVRVLSKKSKAEVSLAYYRLPYSYRAQGIMSSLADLKNSLRDSVLGTKNLFSNANKLMEVVIQFFTRANSFLDTTVVAFDVASFIMDCIMFVNVLIELPAKISEMKDSFSFKHVFYLLSIFVAVHNMLVFLAKLPEHTTSISASLKEIPSAVMTAFSSVKSKFVGQSGINTLVFVGLLESLLPKHLKNLISKIPVYSREKFLDDSSFIEYVVHWVTELPLTLANALCLPAAIVDPLQYVVSCIPFSKAYTFKTKLVDYLNSVVTTKNIIYKPVFQDEYVEFFKGMMEWKNSVMNTENKLPYGFKDVYDRGFKLFKKIEYIRNTTRIEPVFLVFKGPPGTGKTTLLSHLVECLKEHNSVYTHNCHSAEKDFYDQYDGEDVMVIDDIGQKGVFQWGEMINLVSTIQCTLNCASVENKDLKRFTSSLILATTNVLDLRLTPSDPISDVEALYRRIHHVNFDNVRFTNGVYSGEVKIMKRDMIKHIWYEITRFPAEQAVQKIGEYIVEETNKRKQAVPTKNRIVTSIPYIGQMKVLRHAYAYGPGDEGRRFTAAVDFESDLFTNIIVSFLEYPYSSVFLFIVFAAYVLLLCYAIREVCKVCHKFFRFYVLKDKTAFYMSDDELRRYMRYNDLDEPPEWASPPKKDKKKKFYFSDKKAVNELSKFRAEADLTTLFLKSDEVTSNTLNSIKRNSVAILMKFESNVVATGSAMFSGRYFTTVRHNFVNIKERFYVKVYTASDHVVYDMVPASVVWYSDVDDLAICKLGDNVPVFFRKIPQIKTTNNDEGFLVTPQSLLYCGKITKTNFDSEYFTAIGTSGVIDKDDLSYRIQASGLCGSWFVTGDGMLVGHHVAGSSATNEGVSKCFKQDTVNKIFSFMTQDVPVVNVDLDKKFGNAGAVINEPVAIFNAKETNIVPSLIHGIFPLHRKPANLRVFGKDTVKNLMLPSLSEVPAPDMKALKWAQNYMRDLFPTYHRVSRIEAIKGYGDMNFMDLSTSAGYKYPGIKGDYIDSEGNVNDILAKGLEKLEKSFVDGTYAYDSYHKACAKDELRNLAKVDKPRIFCAAPLDIFVLQREMFSDLLVKLHDDRYKYRLGVMVGINPFSDDWGDLLKFITSNGDRCFGGDVANWDKKMNPAIQYALNEILLEKLVGSEKDKKVCAMLLQLLVTTPHVNTDVAYIDTHSLASGVVLTADYNSLVNKFLSLYAFYMLYVEHHSVEPTFDAYSQNIRFVAYGDDSLTGVSENAKFYCPTNIARIFQSLDMDFTPEDKGEWTKEFRTIYECSFLKRTFRIHPMLAIVVAPLEQLSMKSTLNYVKDNFRNRELTVVKLLNFQREAFLHVDYEELMDHVVKHVESFKDLHIIFHSAQYLCSLYTSGEYNDLLELH